MRVEQPTEFQAAGNFSRSQVGAGKKYVKWLSKPILRVSILPLLGGVGDENHGYDVGGGQLIIN